MSATGATMAAKAAERRERERKERAHALIVEQARARRREAEEAENKRQLDLAQQLSLQENTPKISDVEAKAIAESRALAAAREQRRLIVEAENARQIELALQLSQQNSPQISDDEARAISESRADAASAAEIAKREREQEEFEKRILAESAAAETKRKREEDAQLKADLETIAALEASVPAQQKRGLTPVFVSAPGMARERKDNEVRPPRESKWGTELLSVAQQQAAVSPAASAALVFTPLAVSLVSYSSASSAALPQASVSQPTPAVAVSEPAVVVSSGVAGSAAFRSDAENGDIADALAKRLETQAGYTPQALVDSKLAADVKRAENFISLGRGLLGRVVKSINGPVTDQAVLETLKSTTKEANKKLGSYICLERCLESLAAPKATPKVGSAPGAR